MLDSHITTDGESTAPDAREFLLQVANALGSHFRVVSDGTFHWATPFSTTEHAGHAKAAAYALARISQTIPGLITTPPTGGWPAVLFSTREEQFAYDALFADGGGTHIINGGMWRNWPVGHLAIPVITWDSLDAAFAHELVHASLSDTGVPAWLQEGLAMQMETCMGNRTPPLNDLHHWKETLAWWRSHAPYAFWSGEAFGNPESSEHAYRLAQVLALRISNRPDCLQRACLAGPDAWADEDTLLLEFMGGNRVDLFHAIIGPGHNRGWLDRFFYWLFVGERP
jgi:hypothetical protein